MLSRSWGLKDNILPPPPPGSPQTPTHMCACTRTLAPVFQISIPVCLGCGEESSGGYGGWGCAVGRPEIRGCRGGGCAQVKEEEEGGGCREALDRRQLPRNVQQVCTGAQIKSKICLFLLLASRPLCFGSLACTWSHVFSSVAEVHFPTKDVISSSLLRSPAGAHKISGLHRCYLR